MSPATNCHSGKSELSTAVDLCCCDKDYPTDMDIHGRFCGAKCTKKISYDE